MAFELKLHEPTDAAAAAEAVQEVEHAHQRASRAAGSGTKEAAVAVLATRVLLSMMQRLGAVRVGVGVTALVEQGERRPVTMTADNAAALVAALSVGLASVDPAPSAGLRSPPSSGGGEAPLNKNTSRPNSAGRSPERGGAPTRVATAAGVGPSGLVRTDSGRFVLRRGSGTSRSSSSSRGSRNRGLEQRTSPRASFQVPRTPPRSPVRRLGAAEPESPTARALRRVSDVASKPTSPLGRRASRSSDAGSPLARERAASVDSDGSFSSFTPGWAAPVELTGPPRVAYQHHERLIGEANRAHRFREFHTGRQVTATALPEEELDEAAARRRRALLIGNAFSERNAQRNKQRAADADGTA